MKTKLTLLFLALMTVVSFAGDGSQSIVFDDGGLGGGTPTSGTYNSTDTFGFDVFLTYSGYNASGLTFWLETNTAFAASLSIIGVTYGTAFPDAIDTAPNPAFFTHAPGASPGYLTENRDLGSDNNDFGNVPGPGTYFVAHVTLQISGAPPGTFDLASTTVNPHLSEVTSFDGTTFAEQALPAAHYSITIVPEPSAFALIGLGAIITLGFIARRRIGDCQR